MTPDPLPNVHQLLAFYLEAGVDCALAEEPANRLRDPEAAPKEAAANPASLISEEVRPVRPAFTPVPAKLTEPTPAPDAAVASAREAARTAPSLEALRSLLEKFDGCALKSTATRLVFADGNPEARIMFVGEAPGREEDIEGLPFVGRSGKLLDRMIAAIAITLFAPWTGSAEVATSLPATDIAQFFDDSFERRTNQRLRVVSGDAQLATLITLSRDRPHLFLAATPQRTPWTSSSKFNEAGGVVVWRASDTAGTPPADIAQRFPGLVPEVPRSFEWLVNGRQPLLRIGWAIVRPKPP